MHEPRPASRQVLDQISALPQSDRPLIVCDVDEVILHMAAHFETFLRAQDLVFLSHSYRLTGNIARTGTTSPISSEDVRRLINQFFDEESHRQELVPGADEALSMLSEDWDVILLTNLPGAHNKPVRERLLDSFGIPYPVVTNSGPKGGPVSALAAGRPSPVVFIDDSGINHASVNASLPASIQIQFIADDRFRAEMSPEDHIDLFTGDWDQTRQFIGGILQGS